MHPTYNSSNEAPLVGTLTRAQILDLPSWQAAFEHSTATGALAGSPGAEVVVYLGTWCGDSRREVTRLWRALDAAPAPFTLRYVGVDRDKQVPASEGDVDLQRVPTFVVRREGREIGRIVEHAPRGIEIELTEILTQP